MIPKNVFLYWGGSKMSYLRYATLATLRKYNPDWRIVLYVRDETVGKTWPTREPVDSDVYDGDDYRSLIDSLGVEVTPISTREMDLKPGLSDVHVKDILCWRALATEGGVISDMDILYLGSLEQLSDRMGENNTGLVCYQTVSHWGENRLNYLPIAFMASAGNNRLFTDCYERAKQRVQPLRYTSAGTEVFDGKNYDQLSADYGDLKFYRIPDQMVYPFACYPDIELDLAIAKFWRDDLCGMFPMPCVGLHWYGGSPYSMERQCKITHDKSNRENNTITEILRRAEL